MTALVDAMARVLSDAGVGDYATDRTLDPALTAITLNGLPVKPDESVSVTTYGGGPAPDSGNGWEYPRLQVRVRAGGPLAALDLDRAAYVALQFTPDGPRPRNIGGGWWLQNCYALTSEPQPFGVDGNGRHEFVRNYQLAVEPVN